MHVKSPVECTDETKVLDTYRPFINALEAAAYHGHLSIEFLEVDDPDADPLRGTWHAARAIGELIGEAVATEAPSLSLLQPPSQPAALPLRIPEKPVAIVEDALPLMLEGCEHRLDNSPVWLRTFAKSEEKNFWSPSRGSPPGSPGTGAHVCLRQAFCGNVGRDDRAVKQCWPFYAEQFERIKRDPAPLPQVRFCPLGLAVLFVPLCTERDLFGTVVCGGWRESGTEGVIIYGIDRWVGCEDGKRPLEEAILDIPDLTSSALRNAHQTLREATDRLAKLFSLAHQNELVERRNAVVRQFIESVRGQAFRGFDAAAEALRGPVEEMGKALHAAYAAVYVTEESQGSPMMDFEPVVVFCGSSTQRLPNRVSLDPEVLTRPPARICEALGAGLQHSGLRPPEFAYVDGISDTQRCLFFLCPSADARTDDELPRALERIATHVMDTLRTACVFDEAKADLETVEIIADRTRHELNSPLQGIRGAAGRLAWLLQKDPDSEKIQDAAKNIDAYAEEAGRVVDRLSRASLVKARDTEVRGLSLTLVDLKAVIWEASEPFRLAAQERGIQIVIGRSVYNLVSIECDRRHIRTLFANLIENAVKFSHANHTVDIIGGATTLPGPPGEDPRDAVKIVVSDFGLGIPDEDLEGIFEKYTQSSLVDPRRSIGGTGLGLYVCREIVTRHHGTISASCWISPSRAAGLSPKEKRRLLQQGVKVEFTVVLPVSQKGF